ncbi:MAG TPA: ATPase domain-containing protein [Anaerolineae bacterium]|jgi:circadian clock protein KaiC|nr:ATPase domain-containing protein [Anaerolineae bacterium]
MADVRRTPTGVPGLDAMLEGGLITGSIALLQGAPGTGKTTVGMQFLHEGARQYGEAGLLVTFEQFPHTLYRDALAHGWNLRELEQEGMLRVVFTSPQVFLTSLQSPISPINSAIRDMGVKRAVIDSVTQFQTLSTQPVELRAYYNHLINGLRREGITSILLSEDSGPDIVRSDRGRVAFVVDSVILLRYVEIDSVMQRAMAVLKTRGSDHDKNIRRFEIKRGGIDVLEPFRNRQGLLSGTPRRTG